MAKDFLDDTFQKKGMTQDFLGGTFQKNGTVQDFLDDLFQKNGTAQDFLDGTFQIKGMANDFFYVRNLKSISLNNHFSSYLFGCCKDRKHEVESFIKRKM